jgi:hypothetical protein
MEVILTNTEELRAILNDCLAKAKPACKADNPTKSEDERPISQPEAIEFLGKSRQTLVAWRKKGVIKAYRLGGRVYYKKSELLNSLL